MAALGRRREADPLTRRARRGTPADLLAVGLGNPGADYAGTRHNSGADTIAVLAIRYHATLKRSKEHALSTEARVGDRLVALAVPITYYNEAGLAVVALARRHGVEDPRAIVIVHDELDLPVGRLKLKVGGGLAGNNGLKSIKAHLHTDDFVRIRIGVGKPPGRMAGADHVLRRPSKSERTDLDIAIQEAADAVEAIVSVGIDAAMNRYNTKFDPED